MIVRHQDGYNEYCPLRHFLDKVSEKKHFSGLSFGSVSMRLLSGASLIRESSFCKALVKKDGS